MRPTVAALAFAIPLAGCADARDGETPAENAAVRLERHADAVEEGANHLAGALEDQAAQQARELRNEANAVRSGESPPSPSHP